MYHLSTSSTPCPLNGILEALQLALVTEWVDHMLSIPLLCTQQSIQQCQGESAHTVIGHIMDQLMNHLRFHYQMVLVCPICAGCESNSWRTVEAHIKACTRQRPGIASQKVNPGEPLWQSTDNRLRGLTRAGETATTFELQILLMMLTRKTEATSSTKP